MLPYLSGCGESILGKSLADQRNDPYFMDLVAHVYQTDGIAIQNSKRYMKKLIIILFLLPVFVFSVAAAEIEPPTVPDGADAVFPEDPTSFSDGLKEILNDASEYIRPAAMDCLDTCVKLVAMVMLTSLFLGASPGTKKSIDLAAVVSVSVILLAPTNTLIHIGSETITEITNYGKLLLPVMATALAAQGAPSSSAGLYAGTACLNSILGSIVTSVLIPLIYIYLVIAIAANAVENGLLSKVKDFIKWSATWCLKIILYVFTGYMGITGVITGSVDAATMKATKLTISGVVPVVGGIISDASEAILVSAGILKNSAGVYGILALLSILIGPFIKIGVQYLALKLSGALCQAFSSGPCCKILQDFTTAMGIVLAMTGTVCLLQLISTVCFMRCVGL